MLQWSVNHQERAVAVAATGSVIRLEVEDYFDAIVKADAKTYTKFIDLTFARLELSRDDLSAVAGRLIMYSDGERPGPVGMVVRTPATLDMVVLLKQRLRTRPFRIFTSSDEARFWLKSFEAANWPQHTNVRKSFANIHYENKEKDYNLSM